MFKSNLIFIILCSAVIFHCAQFAEPSDDISMIDLFSDNMVLQRGMEIPVWGKGTPGKKISVELADQTVGGVVAEDSTWMIKLNVMKAGGPYTLRAFGVDTLTFTNVMIGEVWICSGQSNMEMPLAGWGKINNFEQEIAAADYPNIRLFQVNRITSPTPLDTVNIQFGWSECSPETVPNFSAVAYFFGRDLHKHLTVPIGLLHTSWGGTPAEAWTEASFLKQMPRYTATVEEMQSGSSKQNNLEQEYEQNMKEWQAALDVEIAKAQQSDAAWRQTDMDDSNWKTMPVPLLWEQADLPGFDGIVFYRKTIDIPDELADQDWMLHLGPIDDSDNTFFNGEKIGAMQMYNEIREYKVPASLVKPGENVIAVEVLDTGGGGGIWGSEGQVKLVSGATVVSLAGEWKYKVGANLKNIPPQPQTPNSPHRPTVLYNAMIAPIIPFAIRGAIWYQGEANASRAYQYRELFPLMINSWRAKWGQGNFPFLFTQLANFMPRDKNPVESDWAELREAQTMALELPNTGMAVTIDIGEAEDIHPKNKQDVGIRLALNARANVYGEDIVYSGPMYESMQVEDGAIRLSFTHVDGGLVARGGTLKRFAIAGRDSNWVWADGKIDGDTIVVSSPDVEDPVAVRYAWANNPDATLFNKAGLPASPFRTDDWPGITINAE